MLEETKELYIELANLVDNWKKLSISELANNYLKYKEENNYLYNNYLSAIICKLWHNISHYFYKYKTIPIEECYNQIIEAVLYVLENHVWTDPNNKLYGDLKGPEKALNVCVSSRILGFFTNSNRDKRKLNYNNIYSIQALSEDENEDKYLIYNDKDNSTEEFIDTKVKEIFDNKDYLRAFVIDTIANYNCFDYNENNELLLNFKKLKHIIKTIDSSYCENFSLRYNIDINKVEKSIVYITKKSYSNIDFKIKQVLTNLKHDEELITGLRGY